MELVNVTNKYAPIGGSNMKKMKNLLAVILSIALVMALCTCGVSAADETAGESTVVLAETKELSLEEELAKELEKLYSSEVPEEFFLIPKEKMVIEGWDWDFAFLHDKIDKGELSWDIFEPLYAYVAIVINHDYLEPKGINPKEFILDFSAEDLDTMMSYFSKSIKKDQLSYNLAESYSRYDLSDFEKDAELEECIVRAFYTYCITAGVKPNDFWAKKDLEMWYGFTSDKITFSDEQLHYFDD